MKPEGLQDDRITRRGFLAGSALALSGVSSGIESPAVSQETPVSAGPADPQLIEDLVAANRILYRERVNDAFGHVSVRHSEDPNRYLLARSLAPDLVTPDDLIEYDLDSNPVNLNGRSQYSERYIHGEIYKARPDVGAVVHNHSADVIPFTVSSRGLRPIFHVASFLSNRVPVFDIRSDFGITDMLVATADRGRALAAVLGNHTAVLMRGHGVSVVGPSLPYVVGRSIYVSFNARVQLQATILGGEITYLDAGEAQAYIDRGESRGYERPWEMWKREAMGA
jgi:ribulose-5-phosphate 4-epimerase/fuculose-1-phosphate aldolase